MGMNNLLKLELKCPRCEIEDTVEAEYYIGFLELKSFTIGDRVEWSTYGAYSTPGESLQMRPEGGSCVGEGYLCCEHCFFEYLIDITVENDIITGYKFNLSRRPHGQYGEIPLEVLKRDFHDNLILIDSRGRAQTFLSNAALEGAAEWAKVSEGAYRVSNDDGDIFDFDLKPVGWFRIKRRGERDESLPERYLLEYAKAMKVSKLVIDDLRAEGLTIFELFDYIRKYPKELKRWGMRLERARIRAEFKGLVKKVFAKRPPGRDDFTHISIKGRMAFAICCFEKALIHFNCRENDWSLVLENMWAYTILDCFDDWRDSMTESLPECIFNDKYDDDYEYLSEEQFNRLHKLYTDTNEYILKLIELIYRAGCCNCYSRLENYGQTSLDMIEEIIDFMVSNQMPLPEMKRFKPLSYKEEGGWGNDFDGRVFSELL